MIEQITSPALEQALETHQTGDLDGAEAAYLSILGNEPENAEVMKLLGVLSCQKNNLDEGMSYLEAAIQLDGSVSEYHFVLGHACLSAGRIEDGLASLLKAAELDPGRADIYGALGDTYQKIQKFADALRAYQRGLVVEPDNLHFLVNAGLTAVFSEQHDVAADYLNKAKSADDSVSSVHYGLCLVCAQAGQIQPAMDHIGQALALEPENPEYQRLKRDLSDLSIK